MPYSGGMPGGEAAAGEAMTPTLGRRIPLVRGLGTRVLGQDANTIAQYRQLMRQYCGQADYYESLAQSDPGFQDTADWYRSLCNEVVAALPRAIQQMQQQEGLSGKAPSAGLGRPLRIVNLGPGRK